jgi:hypothetical protein
MSFRPGSTLTLVAPLANSVAFLKFTCPIPAFRPGRQAHLLSRVRQREARPEQHGRQEPRRGAPRCGRRPRHERSGGSGVWRRGAAVYGDQHCRVCGGVRTVVSTAPGSNLLHKVC